MTGRPIHLATRYRDTLTPRQQDILAMIAKGKTNFEIAQALGMSLDGAKWHVREILAKLNVDSREEAAEAWRRQESVGARVRAFGRALLPARWLVPAAAGLAVIGAAGVAAAIFFIGGDASDEPPASASPTPEATPTPDPNASLNEPLPTDGSSDYGYVPELAYVDPDGTVWVTNADGTGRRQVLDGCTGIGSPKSGTPTGGLRWSPTGHWIACWKEDLSVRAAALDGNAVGEPFAPGECIGPVGGPSFPPGAPGVACQTADGLQVRDVVTGEVLRTYRVDTSGAFRWLPDGGLVAAGPPENAHGTWNVFNRDGTEVAHITDAYVGEARRFAVTSDGRTIAYPGFDGLMVLDLGTGEYRVIESAVFDGIDWGGGGDFSWVLDDTAILARGYPISALVDARTGESLTNAPLPTTGRISPDGRFLVGVVLTNEGRTMEMGVTDLETRTTVPVEGSFFQIGGIGIGAQFAWSGDSSRFCWTTEASIPASTRNCARVAGPAAVAVSMPVQYLAEELGYGDMGIMWAQFSPDMTEIAYTVPGPEQPTQAQTLMASGVEIGPTLGNFSFAWRPDGVVRPD